MGINSCNTITLNATNVVARELNEMINHLHVDSTKQKIIDCDVSNIIYTLYFKNKKRVFSVDLVRNVASHLKQLAADTGYVFVPILDGDI